MAERSGSAVKGNGYDPVIAGRFADDIKKRYRNIASHKGECANRCKGEHDDINRIYDAAKNAGMPKKEMRAAIKTWLLEEQKEAIRAKLEEAGDDSAETYDMILHALGMLADTPLGKAASKGKGMPGADAPGTH